LGRSRSRPDPSGAVGEGEAGRVNASEPSLTSRQSGLQMMAAFGLCTRVSVGFRKRYGPPELFLGRRHYRPHRKRSRRFRPRRFRLRAAGQRRHSCAEAAAPAVLAGWAEGAAPGTAPAARASLVMAADRPDRLALPLRRSGRRSGRGGGGGFLSSDEVRRTCSPTLSVSDRATLVPFTLLWARLDRTDRARRGVVDSL
jgi:hypothetical protein